MAVQAVRGEILWLLTEINMKLFQFLLASLLLVFAGSACGGVYMVHPDEGDYVGVEGFNIIAKVLGEFAPDFGMTTVVEVTNNRTGEVTMSHVSNSGTSNQNGLEIIMPKPKPAKPLLVNYQVVARFTGLTVEGDSLTIWIQTTNHDIGEVIEKTVTVIVR